MPRNRSEKYTPEQRALVDLRDGLVAQYKEWGVAVPSSWTEANDLRSEHGSNKGREKAKEAWGRVERHDCMAILHASGPRGALAYIDKALR